MHYLCTYIDCRVDGTFRDGLGLPRPPVLPKLSTTSRNHLHSTVIRMQENPQASAQQATLAPSLVPSLESTRSAIA